MKAGRNSLVVFSTKDNSAFIYINKKEGQLKLLTE